MPAPPPIQPCHQHMGPPPAVDQTVLFTQYVQQQPQVQHYLTPASEQMVHAGELEYMAFSQQHAALQVPVYDAAHLATPHAHPSQLWRTLSGGSNVTPSSESYNSNLGLIETQLPHISEPDTAGSGPPRLVPSSHFSCVPEAGECYGSPYGYGSDGSFTRDECLLQMWEPSPPADDCPALGVLDLLQSEQQFSFEM